METILREAQKSDALRISTLYQDVYEGRYPDPLMRDLRLLKGALSSDEYCWTVAELNGDLVGSTAYHVDYRNRIAKAFGAVVLPSCRGQKITQKLLTFGYETMRTHHTPIELIYATTRTVSIEPQKLTQNLGYKKLGVFPNVHKTETYETHCLTAFFSPDSLTKRFKNFELHPKILPLYEIVRRECSLDPLEVAPQPAPSIVDIHPTETHLRLEFIDAPLFVRHRFLRERKTVDDHEWFFPFQEPNIILSTPDQKIEVFAYLAPDKHCVLIGVRDEMGMGLSKILSTATQLMRDHGARYIEFLIRADETQKLQIAIDALYIPSAYFPAMQLSQNQRYDFVIFSRSFEILDFHDTQMQGINLEFLRLYSHFWEEIAISPALDRQRGPT